VLIFLWGAATPAQEIQHQAIAVNIEVPVRVYKSGAFVENLTINDFEVYEDGALQEVEAVYLIKNKSIEREEFDKEKGAVLQPEVENRHFVFLFEIHSYLPEVDKAVDHFFQNVMTGGDTLMVFTPVKSYTIKDKAFEILSRTEIADQLKAKLRKDILKGSAEYKSLHNDILDILKLEEMSTDLKCQIILTHLRKMKDLRYFDESALVALSDHFKEIEGQKHVFIFFQKEFLPIPELIGDPPPGFYVTQTLDVDKVKRAFSQSDIASHFLFITKRPQHELDITRMLSTGGQAPDPSAQASQGGMAVHMKESSAELFQSFNELASATGGLTESSANAEKAFQKAVKASQVYYLVYYKPKQYAADNRFHKIEVRIKGGGYRVLHRAGYVAD